MKKIILHFFSAMLAIMLIGSIANAQLANDECSGAIELTSSETCNTIVGTTVGATQSIPATSCNTNTGNADDDVWYKFIATSTTYVITVGIDPDAVVAFAAVIDLRSGVCV